MAPSGGEKTFFLLALGTLTFLVLLFALWLATRARRKPDRKPPKKTFEHGRRLGRARRPLDTDAALAALKACPVGEVVDARAAQRVVEVVVVRRKNQPCVQAAGFLAGLFEAAWAHEVLVAHPECAGSRGGTCRYVIERAPIRIAGRAAEASTPGSATDPRRSLPARPGGG